MPYDNNMQMSLFKVVSDNPRAPVLRAVFEMNGTPFQCSLWLKMKQDGTKVVDKNGNGIYGGKIEVDTYAQQRQAQQQAPQPAPAPQYAPQPPAQPVAPPQYPQPPATQPTYQAPIPEPPQGEEIPF